MKRNQYKIKYDVVLKNKLSNETVTGSIVDERVIDGKSYWVMIMPSRGATRLVYSKESWLLIKGK